MTFLPIVERELRVAARLTATYRNRAILVAIIAVVAVVMLVFGAFSPIPSQVGQSMFWTLATLALLFCLLEGVRKTADCLSEEKREGTLGLLFLTDLKGYDVVLGKLAATSLNSFYGLLSVLPVLALPLLLGGVTPGEFWRVALALASNLFFSLATGLWVSVRSRREQQAMGAALLVIAVVVVIPMFFPRHLLSAISPARAFFGGSARGYALAPQTYWRSLEFTQAMSWMLLGWASLVLPGSWRDDNIVSNSTKNSARRAQNAGSRVQMLEINPAYWLAMRGMGRPIWLYVIIGLILISSVTLLFYDADYLPALLGFFWLLNLILKMRVAAQSCRCFAEARRTNALEMLLVTPLNVEQIIQGQILALRRLFLAPLIIVLAIEIGAIISDLAIQYSAGNPSRRPTDGDIVSEFVLLFIGVNGYLVFFAIDIIGVIWAGMWFGLSSRTGNQATTKTILFALLLPLLSSILFCYGLPLMVGIPFFWIAWGSHKVRREFRRLAAQRHTPNPANAGWLPGGANQGETNTPLRR